MGRLVRAWRAMEVGRAGGVLGVVTCQKSGHVAGGRVVGGRRVRVAGWKSRGGIDEGMMWGGFGMMEWCCGFLGLGG